MQKFTKLTGVAAPLPIVNVDTDMIIPKDYLKTSKRTGLGVGLFAEMRYHEDGTENPDFILNKPAYRKAEILVAGDNFGCGSSREHAVWALHEWGIRAIIAPSFGSIFQGNCVRNGIVPVILDNAVVEGLAQKIEADPDRFRLTVDLTNCTVTAPDGGSWSFRIPDADREMLLEGLDSIAVTLKRDAEILAYRERDRQRRPWIYLPERG